MHKTNKDILSIRSKVCANETTSLSNMPLYQLLKINTS